MSAGTTTAAGVTDWSHGVPLRAGDWFIGLYQPSPETAGFWQAVQRHELVLKWCAGCGKCFHPKRILCAGCGSPELRWRRASGRGTVYSFSEVHCAPSPDFAGTGTDLSLAGRFMYRRRRRGGEG